MSARSNRNHHRGIATAISGGILGLAALVAGCSSEGGESPAGASQTHNGHSDMGHAANGGPVPPGMREAADPTHPVGTEVILSADHMEGMNGARATVVGAYTTTAYSVNFTPTTGSDRIDDHRWVVQEELAGVENDQRLPDGAEVTLEADHMQGMDGAAATVASSTKETVYVVDYESNGVSMTNHKWVVESETKPAP